MANMKQASWTAYQLAEFLSTKSVWWCSFNSTVLVLNWLKNNDSSFRGAKLGEPQASVQGYFIFANLRVISKRQFLYEDPKLQYQICAL